MLAIRLQRTGRKGHAHYRVVVQDAHRSPKSGKVVASIGNFNPHDKTLSVDKEKAAFYLKNGAQPSPRIVRLLSSDGVKMPEWVKVVPQKERTIRNAEKLRKNRPAEEAKPEPVADATEEAPAADEVAEATPETEETTAVETEAAPATEEKAPEPVEEKPAKAAEPATEKAK